MGISTLEEQVVEGMVWPETPDRTPQTPDQTQWCDSGGSCIPLAFFPDAVNSSSENSLPVHGVPAGDVPVGLADASSNGSSVDPVCRAVHGAEHHSTPPIFRLLLKAVMNRAHQAGVPNVAAWRIVALHSWV